MTAETRICIAGLLGLWFVAGVAQEAAEEITVAADAQQEVAPEADSAAAGDAVEAETADQPGVIPGAGTAEQSDANADAGVTEAGAVEPGEAFPEVPPLDELFVPSQNIRADEPVTFPVDF